MSKLKAKWTILTYIAAHNDLDSFGRRSRRQISAVGSSQQVRLGVLFDSPTGTWRSIYKEPGEPAFQEELTGFDSGDPERLVETAGWLFEQYPAENYGLVLWSHGSGWQPDELEKIAQQAGSELGAGEAEQRSAATTAPALFRTSLAKILTQSSDQRAILFDDGSQYSLDTLELFQVIERISQKIGQPLALLGMDACLMASMEVAYQIRDSVNFLVASEELVPADSWPYDSIYGKLKANPEMSSAELAATITEAYAAYYHSNPPRLGGDVTKVALRLAQVKMIAYALDQLSQHLIAEMEVIAPLLWDCQLACRERELSRRERSKFDQHLWDIRSLSHELSTRQIGDGLQTACQGVLDALQQGGAILRNIHQGSWFEDIGGVSVYLPMPKESPGVTRYYPELSFAKDTCWDEMLLEYHQAAKKGRVRRLPQGRPG